MLMIILLKKVCFGTEASRLHMRPHFPFLYDKELTGSVSQSMLLV